MVTQQSRDYIDLKNLIIDLKKIDFECLVICRNNNVIPRFLHICLGNKS